MSVKQRWLPLPAQMSVRDARDAYLLENGFEIAEYDAPRGRVSAFGYGFTIPNPPGRQRAIRHHDFHHVATGYGTDLAGEAEISAWEFRSGLSRLPLYVRALVTFGFLQGFVVAPLRTIRAFRAAKNAASLFNLPYTSDELLELTVGELRAVVGVPREGLAALPRRLHSTAPVGAPVSSTTR